MGNSTCYFDKLNEYEIKYNNILKEKFENNNKQETKNENKTEFREFKNEILANDLNEREIDNKEEIIKDNIKKLTEEKENNIIESKQVICPQCKEICFFKIQNYKINLFDCINGHETNNIFLDEFSKTQNIDKSKIICNICNKINKSNSDNKQFFKCIQCKKNLCSLCVINHKNQNNHIIIDYENKDYFCNIHGESFISYCPWCKINLCNKCKHNHKLINFNEILPSKDIIIKKNYLGKFNDNIKRIINQIKNKIEQLNKIILNLEKLYEIIYNIINNTKSGFLNYQTIENNNVIFHYIIKRNREFNHHQFVDLESLFHIYEQMTTKDDNVNVKELKENEIKILVGDEIDNCPKTFIYNKYIYIFDLKNKLKEQLNLKDDFILTFYGKEMNNDMRLNDYNVELLKKNVISIIYKSEISNKYLYNQWMKVNILFNNKYEFFFTL